MEDNFEHQQLRGVKAPKLCYTAGGMLIHDKKVLLVKHKKLAIWLNPGGHIDEGELPHQAAEREFFEETGIKVRALDSMALPGVASELSLVSKSTEFQPNPVTTNLHWVNKESYKLRLASKNPKQRYPTKLWKRGCEQHVGFFYILEAVAGLDFIQNKKETDGIAWFGLSEIDNLETKDSIKDEIKLGFRLMNIT